MEREPLPKLPHRSAPEARRRPGDPGRLEVAIAFSDHVVRDRTARWRRRRTWLRWTLAGSAPVAFLAMLVIVSERRTSTATGCVLGADCLADGTCSLPPGEPVTPITTKQPASSNPCGLSTECARHGRCATAPGGCYVSSDEDCRGSWDCQIDGLCQLVAGRCTAETDQDCAASRDCKLEDRCAAYGGRCLSVDDFETLEPAGPASVEAAWLAGPNKAK